MSSKSKDIKKEEVKHEKSQSPAKQSQVQQKINFESKNGLAKKPKEQWDYFAFNEKYKNV